MIECIIKDGYKIFKKEREIVEIVAGGTAGNKLWNYGLFQPGNIETFRKHIQSKIDMNFILECPEP